MSDQVDWRLRDDMHRAIKRALNAAEIEIPFPQRVIHQQSDVVVGLAAWEAQTVTD